MSNNDTIKKEKYEQLRQNFIKNNLESVLQRDDPEFRNKLLILMEKDFKKQTDLELFLNKEDRQKYLDNPVNYYQHTYLGSDSVSKNAFNTDVTSKEYMDSLLANAYQNYAGLNIDPNSAQSQQYKNDMYAAIAAEQAETEAALSRAEIDAYKQIGYQQQELENQIAENRMKALKSGTTSAQLAAQQLNNMFAAQQGAAQIAGNAMNNRVSNAMDYAKQRAGVTGGLYDTINQNQTTLATAGAQNAAGMLSYAGYVNQQLANLQANTNALDYLGKKDFNKIYLQ